MSLAPLNAPDTAENTQIQSSQTNHQSTEATVNTSEGTKNEIVFLDFTPYRYSSQINWMNLANIFAVATILFFIVLGIRIYHGII